MSDLDSSNYTMIRNIPYLNFDSGAGSTYKSDIIDLSANSNTSDIQQKILNMNEDIKTYLINRSNIDQVDNYATDNNFIELIESNNNLAHNDLYNKTHLVNNINNKMLNLKNNYNFNNVMLQTLENDASGGEIDTINKNINNLDRDISEKKKQLDVNTYYEKKFSHQIKQNIEQSIGVIVPKKTIYELSKLLSELDKEIEIIVSASKIIFLIENLSKSSASSKKSFT